jgi:hypothetical protein
VPTSVFWPAAPEAPVAPAEFACPPALDPLLAPVMPAPSIDLSDEQADTNRTSSAGSVPQGRLLTTIPIHVVFDGHMLDCFLHKGNGRRPAVRSVAGGPKSRIIQTAHHDIQPCRMQPARFGGDGLGRGQCGPASLDGFIPTRPDHEGCGSISGLHGLYEDSRANRDVNSFGGICAVGLPGPVARPQARSLWTVDGLQPRITLQARRLSFSNASFRRVGGGQHSSGPRWSIP